MREQEREKFENTPFHKCCVSENRRESASRESPNLEPSLPSLSGRERELLNIFNSSIVKMFLCSISTYVAWTSACPDGVADRLGVGSVLARANPSEATSPPKPTAHCQQAFLIILDSYSEVHPGSGRFW